MASHSVKLREKNSEVQQNEMPSLSVHKMETILIFVFHLVVWVNSSI